MSNVLATHWPHFGFLAVGVAVFVWMACKPEQGKAADAAPVLEPVAPSPAPANVKRSVARRGLLALGPLLGTVATESAKSYLSREDFAAAAQPEEVANVLAFLASRSATGINGALVDVNAREVD